MSAKSKSGLPDTPGSKATPGTPRVAKAGKTPSKLNADSPSPLQSMRASAERSPRTVASKSGIARLSPRVATPPEKSQSRILKPSELQSQLAAAQDELKKAKEKLVLVEKEKTQALSELEEARILASSDNEKLQDSVVAEKRAENSSEVEESRDVELEQVGIEAVRKKEEEWQKELQEVRNQHAMDMSSLLSTSEELQRTKQELAVITDTKNQALVHAEEATKIAEIHAEKVDILSAEVARLNSLLDSTIKTEASGNATMMELNLELDSLKQELEVAKGFEKNLAEKEESCVLLDSELSSVKGELERAKGSGKILAQKEESCELLELEFESMKQMLEKTKGLEENLCQKEEASKQLKSELESLKAELERANGFEENLVKKDESLQQLKSELESLNQELEKAKGFEAKLSEREESCEQLKSESDFLKHELEKAKGFEENLILKDESLQQLELEMAFLKQEREKAISFEEKLSQREESYEQLNVELEASRMAESYARNLLEEWKSRVEALELQVKESSKLEESMKSATKELEGKGDLLHEAECEINSLKEKVSLQEISLGRQKVDQEESEQNLEKARDEVSAAAREIVAMKSELEAVKEKEKLAACSVQELLEEKKKLISEIEALREEEEKREIAMESLASALHESSAEAREAKEKLLSSQSEQAGLGNQIEDLKILLKETNEKYESQLDDSKCEITRLMSNMEHSKLEFEYQIEDMRLVMKEAEEKHETLLSDAKHEIDQLTETVEHLKTDHENEKSEWEQKEVQLVNCLKAAEEEKLALSAENEKHEAMLDDAKHDIDHLRKAIDQSKMEFESSKSEWQEKELQLVSSVKRFEEEKLAHKTTDVNHGTMIDDAKDEIKHLSNMIEKSKVQYGNSKHEWEKKELRLVNSMKRSEEEKSSMEREILRLANLLREKEEEARSEKEGGSELRNTLKDAMSEAACLREALNEAKAEEIMLKTDLQDRENQLQTLTREKAQLQQSADANIRKVAELSKLLEEATARKQSMGNGELSDSEKDYDMLPRVVEFSEENGHVHKREDNNKHRPENQPQQLGYPEKEASASKTVAEEGKAKREDGISDLGPKMWESCKIDEHDFSMDREGEHESIDDELDSKAEASDGFDQLNGVHSESDKASPVSKEQQQKKKKPLYRKFGNLLKKGIGNQK